MSRGGTGFGSDSGVVRVVVVDDHALFLEALCDRLEREPDIRVVGRALDAGEAIEQVRTLRPDVVLLDIDMPGPSAFDAAATMTAERAGPAVVFLSASTYDHYLERALAVRARGYVSKADSLDALVCAVLHAASGAAYFSEGVRNRIVVDSGGARLADATRTRLSLLSRRELQVLTRIAEGRSKKEIATDLGVSEPTVRTHANRLMVKLGIHDRVELARYAIRERLIEP